LYMVYPAMSKGGTMNEPPEPFTPCDCDLRGMEWMPLFGSRLFMSDFEARATDEVFRAAVRLWWMAWQQVPAASLPDDDFVLCKLAGLGKDVKAWKRMRAADALHGFTLCSDGRLYHGLLADQAREAWDRRVKERERKAAYRAKYHNGTGGTGNGHDTDVPRDTTRDNTGTERVTGIGLTADGDGDCHVDRTRQDRTGTGQEKEKGRENPPKPPRSRACQADPEFAAFYDAYPRHDAPDDALKAWRQVIAKGATAAEIMAGLARYQFRSDPQYIRLPAGWLRGGCWKAAATEQFDPVLRAVGLGPEDFADDLDPRGLLQ
jgi:hypothetical protein